MSREQLKSVALVSLFGLCVLLVSQIWSDISLDIFNYSNKGTTVEFEKVQIDQVISPQGFVFNFGGKSHTVNYSDKYQVWQGAKPGIIEILSSGDSMLPIDYTKWIELNTYRSIRLRLPYTVSAPLLLDFLTDGSKTTSVDVSFNEILIPLRDRSMIYLGDTDAQTYYSVTGTRVKDDLETLIDYVESSEEVFYHAVDDHYGLSTILSDDGMAFARNENLMPRYQVEEIPVVKVEQEINITDQSEEAQRMIQAYTDKAFEGRYDFVNRLQDVDGSIVLIYGYGERALKLGVKGEIEYKEKLDTRKAGPKLGYKDSLKVAIDFVNQYGGLPNGMYLKSFSENTGSDDRGYRYTFGYRVQGYPVVSSKELHGDAIEVEVYGTQVLSFKRLIRRYNKIADIPEIMGQQVTIDDIFTMNAERIHDDFQRIENMPFDKNRMYEILQSMNDARIVYYSDTDLNGERLIPAWYISIGSNAYYFNMHTGGIIKTIKAN